jgi:hypothetical protein
MELERHYRHLGIRRRLESRILSRATHQLDPIEEYDLAYLVEPLVQIP